MIRTPKKCPKCNSTRIKVNLERLKHNIFELKCLKCGYLNLRKIK